MSDAPEPLSIDVIVFSHVRQALGTDRVLLTLPIDATAGDVEDAIRNRAPDALASIPLRIAVNHIYVDRDVALADGDEVAVIPPVQGG